MGGGVLEAEGRGEGVAGGVVCGGAVLGERGVAGLRVEWSGVGRRAVLATDSVQRGRTGEASAQSITISHSTRCVLGLVQSATRVPERVEEWQTQGMRATDAALLSFGDRR